MHRADPSHGDGCSDDDSSLDEATPIGRRGTDGGGGGGGGGARSTHQGSGAARGGHRHDARMIQRRVRRPRRRHRAAAGQRAEDLKTYDPKAIGECRTSLFRTASC